MGTSTSKGIFNRIEKHRIKKISARKPRSQVISNDFQTREASAHPLPTNNREGFADSLELHTDNTYKTCDVISTELYTSTANTATTSTTQANSSSLHSLRENSTPVPMPVSTQRRHTQSQVSYYSDGQFVDSLERTLDFPRCVSVDDILYSTEITDAHYKHVQLALSSVKDSDSSNNNNHSASSPNKDSLIDMSCSDETGGVSAHPFIASSAREVTQNELHDSGCHIDEATMRSFEQRSLRRITLDLSKGKFIGLNLVGGSDSAFGNLPIFVKEVAQGGVAEMFNIKSGDEIIGINNISLEDKPLQFAVERLRQYSGKSQEIILWISPREES